MLEVGPQKAFGLVHNEVRVIVFAQAVHRSLYILQAGLTQMCCDSNGARGVMPRGNVNEHLWGLQSKVLMVALRLTNMTGCDHCLSGSSWTPV